MVLLGGDFTNYGCEDEVLDFCDFLQHLPHKHKLVISGNHDTVLHTEFYEENWWRFHLEKVDAESVKSKLKTVCTYLEVFLFPC